ncbi:MAG TPA: translation initiation factor IF-2, partial [Dehalococcoidia bacterium]|nr:translation initiation factor IF-2 [Dehalococcoidia bacterium]
VKDLNIILKTDVQGSIEPIKNSIERQATEQVKARVIHASSGNISESDVLLALASDAIIVGFNTRAEQGAQKMAEMEKINIRYYDVIYDLIDDVSKAIQGMLEPTYAEVVIGNAEVRAVFDAGKSKKIAGIAVKDGKAARDASVRVIRNSKVVNDGRINSLRRFKDDVKEVAAGFECGIGIEGFSEFQVGDVLQFYRRERVE